MSTKYLGSTKDSFTNNVGTELCWGWSPAFDFMALLNDRMIPQKKEQPSPAASAGPSKEEEATVKTTTNKKKKTKVQGFDEDGFPILVEEEEPEEDVKDDENAKQEAKSSNNNNNNNNKPVNILLLGAADVRHIIMTLARIKRSELGRSKRPINFYLFEPSLRVHCRHLLFFQLLLVDLVTLSELEDRVSVVLEIYGNSLLRDISASVLKNAALAVCGALECEDEGAGEDAKDAKDAKDDENETKETEQEKQKNNNNIGNKNKNQKLANWLDWSNMKAKEKDFISQQILLWTKNKTHVDILAQWDSRVRQELAERYDVRVNIFDWDFNFSLLDYTQLLRFPEYREFRKIGQGFDYCRINPRRGFRYDYTVPNKSLAYFHPRTLQGSFNGDIKNGPFFGLGQETENPHLKKREVDGTTIYGCGVIAMHNVRSWLYELVTGDIFPTDLQHKIAWDDDKNYNMLPPKAPEPHIEYQPEVAPCTFHMVGLDIEKFLDKICRENNIHEGSEGYFDAAFVASTCTQFMSFADNKFFRAMNQKHGVIVAETLKFVVDANDDAKQEFERKIVESIARPRGWDVEKKLTEKMHEMQLKPKDRPDGVELDASAKKARVRQAFHHAVVLEKKQ